MKTALSNAEKGKATLAELARAHSICERVGAIGTAGTLRSHYSSGAGFSNSGLKNTLRGVGIGVVSGTIVWFLLGRRR